MSRNSNRNSTDVLENEVDVVELDSDTEVTTEVDEAQPVTEVLSPEMTDDEVVELVAAHEAQATEAEVNLAEVFDFQDGGSPYKLITSANRAFKAMGINKVLATQMGYAYAKNGTIDGIKRVGPNPTKNVKFSRETGLKWFTQYVTKNFS
jgi:hypothetical protein